MVRTRTPEMIVGLNVITPRSWASPSFRNRIHCAGDGEAGPRAEMKTGSSEFCGKKAGICVSHVPNGVQTDLGMRQSAGLFAMLKRIGTGRIVTRSLGEAAVSCVSCSAALLQLLPGETARVVGEAFDDDELGQAAAARLLAAGVTP